MIGRTQSAEFDKRGAGRVSSDLIEEETSKVVVPLTQKSSEHNEEQKQFRAESRSGVGTTFHAFIDYAYGTYWFPVRGGLPILEIRRERGGTNSSVLRRHLRNKRSSESARWKTSVGAPTVNQESYIRQPRAYRRRKNPFVCTPYSNSDFNSLL
jgi:hypothetical protein